MLLRRAAGKCEHVVLMSLYAHTNNRLFGRAAESSKYVIFARNQMKRRINVVVRRL